MRKIICIVTICFMITTIFAGCGVLQKLGLLKNNNDELHPVSSIVMNEDEAKTLNDKVPIHLYFANEDNTKLKLEIRYIPVTEAKKSPNTLASNIVKELIKGPSADSGLKATIPAGTQLVAPVDIKAGVATVNLSKEFKDKHPGGPAAEKTTIFSIVNSLTEMKEIQKVKFLINGKTNKEFKGSLQFDAPFPRSASMISKEPVVVPKDTKQEGTQKETAPKKQDGDKTGEDKTKETSGDASEDSEETYIDLEEEEVLE